MQAPAAVPILRVVLVRCGLGCRTPLPSPTGSIATPAAAWCWAATPRRCGAWVRCLPRGRSRKSIGRSSTADRRMTRAVSKPGSKSLPAPRAGTWSSIPAGQHAVTDYRVLGAGDGRAWLELRPRTGRTHQIRVHCAALGCPVVGDPVYGRAGRGPLLLHARSIALPLYPAKPPITVTATPPPHMLGALVRLGYDRAPQPAGGNSG